MYINNTNIIYYVIIGIIGFTIGQFVDWSNKRLPDYKKVFSKEFFIFMVRKRMLYVDSMQIEKANLFL